MQTVEVAALPFIVECGEIGLDRQPVIYPVSGLPGYETYCPAILNRAEGTIDIPVPFILTMAEAFDAALHLGSQ